MEFHIDTIEILEPVPEGPWLERIPPEPEVSVAEKWEIVARNIERNRKFAEITGGAEAMK